MHEEALLYDDPGICACSCEATGCPPPIAQVYSQDDCLGASFNVTESCIAKPAPTESAKGPPLPPEAEWCRSSANIAQTPSQRLCCLDN